METREMIKGRWFWVDKIICDEYGKKIGHAACMVYTYLCRYANEDQICWPGSRRISEDLKMNRRTVYKSISLLIKHNLISLNSKRHNQRIYTLNNLLVQNSTTQEDQTNKVVQNSTTSGAKIHKGGAKGIPEQELINKNYITKEEPSEEKPKKEEADPLAEYRELFLHPSQRKYKY